MATTKASEKTLFPAPEARPYVICRNARGGYKVFRVRKKERAAPSGWTVVETVVGEWAKVQARVAELAKVRDAAAEASIERANAAIRKVIGNRIRPGVRVRVTEAELQAKGLTAALAHFKLGRPEKSYLAWVEAGKPPL